MEVVLGERIGVIAKRLLTPGGSLNLEFMGRPPLQYVEPEGGLRYLREGPSPQPQSGSSLSLVCAVISLEVTDDVLRAPFWNGIRI